MGPSIGWVMLPLAEIPANTADNVVFTPGGTISANNVQDAILELDANAISGDCPPDGSLYCRYATPGVPGKWLKSPTGIADAPTDGSTYGRSSGAWDKVLSLDNGGTLTGTLQVGTGGQILAPDPTALQQVATKNYVDTHAGSGGGGGGTTVYVSDNPPVGAPANSLWWSSSEGLLYVNYQDVDSLQWVIVSPGGGGGGTTVSIGPTPPASPVANSLWWNNTDGCTYIYYNDGTSSQWVLSNPVPSLTGLANLIISDTAPTSAPVNSFWWNSTNGTLYVMYNSGSGAQWVVASPTINPAAYVAKSGDTMTGELIITSGGLNVTGASYFAGNIQASGTSASFGAGSTAPASIVTVNGGNAGTSGGGALSIGNAGSVIMGIGNYSTFYGGAFSATPTLYANAQISVSNGMHWLNGNLISSNGTFQLTTQSGIGSPPVNAGILLSYVGGSTQYGMGFIQQQDNTTYLQFYSAGGTAIGSISQNGSGTLYNTSSDARLKDDEKDFDGSAVIAALKPKNFRWTKQKTRAHGLFAQEAIKVHPEAVTHDETTDDYFIDYSKFVPVLIRAVQQLQARVDELEARK